MIDPVAVYFGAERAGALVLIGIAVAALEVGYTVWRKSGTLQARSAAVALAIVAAIQLGVGGTVFVRAPQQQAQVAQALQQRQLERVRSEEIPRMQAVVDRLVLHRVAQAVVLIAALAALRWGRKGSRLRGTGAGLAPQAAMMLLFDHLAAGRAQAYLAWLHGL